MKHVDKKTINPESSEEKLQNARLFIHSSINAARAVCALNRGDGHDVTAPDLLEVLMDKGKKFEDNPNSQMLETMLLNQISTLEALFTKAMIHTASAVSEAQVQTWGHIALKAQNQCRKTIISLHDLKHPKKAVFIKQTNQALHQQVHNVPELHQLENSETYFENELLKEAPHETVDLRRARKTTAIDSTLEAVATGNRRENTGRKSEK